jgi:dynein heavy chain 2
VAVQDTNFTTSLELAVRFGKTLIIQEMDGVEPILYPILRGDLVAQGSLLVMCTIKIQQFGRHFYNNKK